MTPLHAALPLEELERTICREVGHRPMWIDTAAPVTEFWWCVRCGKILGRGEEPQVEQLPERTSRDRPRGDEIRDE